MMVWQKHPEVLHNACTAARRKIHAVGLCGWLVCLSLHLRCVCPLSQFSVCTWSMLCTCVILDSDKNILQVILCFAHVLSQFFSLHVIYALQKNIQKNILQVILCFARMWHYIADWQKIYFYAHFKWLDVQPAPLFHQTVVLGIINHLHTIIHLHAFCSLLLHGSKCVEQQKALFPQWTDAGTTDRHHLWYTHGRFNVAPAKLKFLQSTFLSFFWHMQKQKQSFFTWQAPLSTLPPKFLQLNSQMYCYLLKDCTCAATAAWNDFHLHQVLLSTASRSKYWRMLQDMRNPDLLTGIVCNIAALPVWAAALSSAYMYIRMRVAVSSTAYTCQTTQKRE